MNKQPKEDNTIKYYFMFAVIFVLATLAHSSFVEYLKVMGQ